MVVFCLEAAEIGSTFGLEQIVFARQQSFDGGSQEICTLCVISVCVCVKLCSKE